MLNPVWKTPKLLEICILINADKHYQIIETVHGLVENYHFYFFLIQLKFTHIQGPVPTLFEAADFKQHCKKIVTGKLDISCIG